MKLISHRGNIDGINPKLENSPDYIKEAINRGYDVEIDVWIVNNRFMLGHDTPIYFINEKFLENSKLWCHAKNFEALNKMIINNNINCFWHNEDRYTLTKSGHIWTYPYNDNIISSNSIVVLPEKLKTKKYECYGICSDFIKEYNGFY